jgi:hypothetical protein
MVMKSQRAKGHQYNGQYINSKMGDSTPSGRVGGALGLNAFKNVRSMLF